MRFVLPGPRDFKCRFARAALRANDGWHRDGSDEMSGLGQIVNLDLSTVRRHPGGSDIGVVSRVTSPSAARTGALTRCGQVDSAAVRISDPCQAARPLRPRKALFPGNKPTAFVTIRYVAVGIFPLGLRHDYVLRERGANVVDQNR
jgi:hypothetical protein